MICITYILFGRCTFERKIQNPTLDIWADFKFAFFFFTEMFLEQSSTNHMNLFKNIDFDWGWGYTHDRRADAYRYPHDRRADKDSYPHDGNVTDDLCSFNETLFCIYYG